MQQRASFTESERQVESQSRSSQISSLAPSDVVVEDDLQVLRRVEDSSHGVVARIAGARVDVEDFAVAFVLEEQAALILGDYRVVRCRIRRRRVSLPIIEAIRIRSHKYCAVLYVYTVTDVYLHVHYSPSRKLVVT